MSMKGAIIKPRTSKKDDPLAKRVPRNPKYKNIEPLVDSGSSLTRYLKRIEEIRANYRYKPNELFKRMKVTTFVQLIIQVSTVDENVFFDDLSEGGDDRTNSVATELENIDQMDSPRSGDSITDNRDTSASGMETSRSTLHSLITGTGEFDVKTKEIPADSSNRTPTVEPDIAFLERPFLVLDTRDVDEFRQCHIISAENFPIAMLSRSCNYESKTMLAYKNQPGKIIIIYDEDERVAPKAATTLVERGYDNLFLLSGGLKVAAKLYPQGLITGSVPASIVPNNKVQTIEAPSKDKFTRDDVLALLDQTETAISDSSVGSRLSRASQASSRTGPPSTARSTASSATSNSYALHRKPFR